jgi:hypothetical protein
MTPQRPKFWRFQRGKGGNAGILGAGHPEISAI